MKRLFKSIMQKVTAIIGASVFFVALPMVPTDKGFGKCVLYLSMVVIVLLIDIEVMKILGMLKEDNENEE